MFQYACLISCAKRMKTKALCPQSEEYRYFSKSRLSECFKLGNAEDGYVNPSSVSHYEEPKFSYSREILDLNPRKDHNLSGYFQSEKYFEDNKDSVFEEFRFNDSIEEESSKLGLPIDDMVSVHVRRGDYLNISEVHPIQGEEYYKEAIDFFKGKEFIVFSDDIQWCKGSNIFSGDGNKKFHFSENNQYVDLCLMSKCSGHIIANSSYSWWGAWLSKSKDVFAPKKWFGNKGPSDWDSIYCNGWKLL